MKLSGILLVSSLPVVFMEALSYRDCSGDDPKEKYGFSLASLTFDPKDPELGSNVTFTANGKLTEEINGNTTIGITLKVNSILQEGDTFMFCVEIPGIECPINVGDVTFSYTYALDKYMEEGFYEIGLRGFNDFTEMFCIDISGDLEGPDEPEDFVDL